MELGARLHRFHGNGPEWQGGGQGRTCEEGEEVGHQAQQVQSGEAGREGGAGEQRRKEGLTEPAQEVLPHTHTVINSLSSRSDISPTTPTACPESL